MTQIRGTSLASLLWVATHGLTTIAGAIAYPTDSTGCLAMLDAGDSAFLANDAESAFRHWRSSGVACADTRLDPALRAKGLLRQARLPENARREADLLLSAEQLLDRTNLEHASVLAEILRRRALIRIGQEGFEGGESLLLEAAGLLRARFGEGSAEELNLLIELESQRIAFGVMDGDLADVERAVDSLEQIQHRMRSEPSLDRGVAISLAAVLAEGYEALGRNAAAREQRLELNRLLH